MKMKENLNKNVITYKEPNGINHGIFEDIVWYNAFTLWFVKDFV